MKNPEGVRGKRKQEVCLEHKEVVRVQRKKIQCGQKVDKRF